MFSLLAKSGSASSGELGRRKDKEIRVRLVSLLRLRLCADAVVDMASALSTGCGMAVTSSFLFSFSESPVIVPLVRNARLDLFLSFRASRPSGMGDVTLVPLTCCSSDVGLAAASRDVAAASHEAVGERVCCGGLGGARIASSR